MANRTKINAAVRTKVSKEILVREASRLYDVLRALGKTKTDVVSDQLWEAIMQRWSESELLAALKTFERSKKVDAFEELLNPLPQAGKDGFFEADEEWWGTKRALASKLQISHPTINSKIVFCRKRKGKIPHTKSPGNFYALTDMKKACAKLLKLTFVASKDGFIRADGEIWGTIETLPRRIPLSRYHIRKRVASCRRRRGRNRSGLPVTFYALSDVRKACADLLKPKPAAEKNDLLKKEGEWWGLASVLARKLKQSTTTLRKHLQQHRCRYMEGKDLRGHAVRYYSLLHAKKICAELLDSPQTNEEGFLELEGELWGTTLVLAQRLKTGRTRIANRILSCRSRRGRDRGGNLCTFYSLRDLENAHPELTQKMPEADHTTGLFAANGELWGSLRSLAKALRIERPAIKKRVISCRTMLGKDSTGKIVIFYSLSDVKKSGANRSSRGRAAPSGKPDG